MIALSLARTISRCQLRPASRGLAQPSELEASWLAFDRAVTPLQASSVPPGACEPDTASSAQPAGRISGLEPGRRLGPYRLVERLGQGGQGEVWKTRRTGPDGELVALKVLKPELAHIPAHGAVSPRGPARGKAQRAVATGCKRARPVRRLSLHGHAVRRMLIITRRDQVAGTLSHRRRDGASTSVRGAGRGGLSRRDCRCAGPGGGCARGCAPESDRAPRRQAGQPAGREPARRWRFSL